LDVSESSHDLGTHTIFDGGGGKEYQKKINAERQKILYLPE